MLLKLDTTVGGNDSFAGKNKEECLKKLRQTLQTAEDLDGTQVSIAYKETRTLTLHDGEWNLEICENGVGEARICESEEVAINEFVAICAEDGDHWE